MTSVGDVDIRGPEMFARYAYAPNQLGYCGPPDLDALTGGSVERIRAAARRFSGAWPYLRVLSALTGISDPLDYRLVESYWLGGGVGAALDADEFYAALLAVIGPQAGHYWSHLDDELAGEAAGNHCFHVFGVYPWTRFLGRGMDEHPLHVLDSCRITPATVLARHGDHAEVRCQRLEWVCTSLQLSVPTTQTVEVRIEGYSAVPDVQPGESVAVHWGRVCGRLDATHVRDLDDSTDRQLSVTNRRLAVVAG